MTFHVGRSDGRSNQQVIIDLTHGVEPGTMFTYDQLAEALREGSSRAFALHDVQSIVRTAGPRLLKEYQRALRNVAKVGYKLCHAKEHTQLSVIRRHKGELQYRRGFALLEQVRWDELDDNSRKLHEGQLLIVGAMHQQMRAFERRMAAVEKAIRSVVG